MNKYDIIEQIGQGIFSQVYLCKEKYNSNLMFSDIFMNKDLFVIKVINLSSYMSKYKVNYIKKPILSENKSIDLPLTPYDNTTPLNEQEYYIEKFNKLIKSEIDILNLSNHKNIIEYISHDIIDNNYYIKMEYCHYGDLYNLLQNKNFESRNEVKGFSFKFIHSFLKDIVGAMEYLHDLNIIHRDIKLNNVLVEKSNDNTYMFKLCDLGFVCIDLTETNNVIDKEEHINLDILKQKYYKLCGTPYYMAPELILNIKKFKKSKFVYNKSIDIWSLGICIYQLIYNRFPFKNINNINDLSIFFSKSTCQFNIHKMIDKINNKDIKQLLKKVLQIDYISRPTINNLNTIINNIHINELEDITYQLKTINLNESNLNLNSWEIPENGVELESSWEQINDNKTLINFSVDSKFKNWLFD